MSDENPKDRFGKMKVPMGLVSPCAIAYEALAMDDGREKYGKTNWRENKVIASIYVDAAIRHLQAWYDVREEFSADTVAKGRPVPHLGHARACIGIIIDALEGGNLIDDRPTVPGPFVKVLEKFTKTMVQTPESSEE